ncbi:hypothetical protein [Acidisoma cladoniae]|jgi:hypothetical protein|uniref:hypothetical protein n=1 Tax=Acidisoma cladoniae TaxID=3040935 RepID=UPI00254E469B|nr:hypothetical protein [Acidisoma sp. PAMC 29798]
MTRDARLWRPLAMILVVLGCAVGIIPFAPKQPGVDLDSAWAFAVNAAVSQHLVFGRDLIFAFGPYASVYTLSFHPATYGFAMVASVILAAAMAAGLITLATGRSLWLAVLLAVLLNLLWLRDPLFFMVPLLFVALTAKAVARTDALPKAMLGVGALLVIALAVLPLVKGTFAAGTLVALGLGGGLLLFGGRWRLVAAGALLFPVAMVAFWLAAQQPLGALPDFFIAQSRFVGGYTQAMALSGPAWQVDVFAAVAMVVLALNLRPALRAGLPGLVVLLGAAVLLLLALKAGFVRQDTHIAIAAGGLGLIACVLALANGGKAPVLALIIGLAGAGVLDRAAEHIGPRAALLRLETTSMSAAQGLRDRLKGGDDLQRNFDATLAGIRAAYPLPPLSGTSDIYSDGQSILLAHHLQWAPRPILQSYSAYTPALAQDDARHLDGAAAPDNVLIKLEPIDNRLPALEDGPSWLALLAGYQPVAMQGDMAILHRRPGPAPATLGTPGPMARHTLGERVSVPPDMPLWAQIDVQPTLLGRVVGAVFKLPPLNIAVHLRNGGSIDFRYVPGMGRAGFVIAPLVADAGQLVSLVVPKVAAFDDRRVAAFMIEGDTRFWRRDYAVTLTPLLIPSRPEVRAVVFRSPQPVTLPPGEAGAHCWLDLYDGTVVDHAKPLVLSGMVRLNGWGFGQGVEADRMAVSLRGPDSRVVTAPALIQYRPDVGAYFHQPQLTQVGYQALLDLRGLSGPFRLALEMTTGGHHWSCPLVDPVTVVAEH